MAIQPYMSEQAARATRRNLRRVIGAEAIGVVDEQSRDIAQLISRVNFLTTEQARHERVLASLNLELRTVREALPKTFREHIQWLFAGGW